MTQWVRGDIQELLSLSVVVGLAVGGDVLLVGLSGLVGSSGGDELVRELGLVRRVGDLGTIVRHRSSGSAKEHTCS